MKFKIFCILIVIVTTAACVQKSYNRTIIFTLVKPDIAEIKSVGIRGNDKPLSWEKDFPMRYDSLTNRYKAIVTINTGYLFTEVKFTVNGDFEFKNQENRIIKFENNDTVYYNAKFNSR